MSVRRFGASVLLAVAVGAVGAAAEEKRPRILLVNDDGIDAPGLAAAFKTLSRLGEITVAAPKTNQSGVGHGITYADPIFIDAIEPLVRLEGQTARWHRISARPATCVRVALTSLVVERPDLVVSGINRGDNAGLSIHVSGTVAAAREAAFDGIPAIAASLVTSPQMDYERAAAWLARIAARLLELGLPPRTFLSVNFPAVEFRGVKVVPHSLLPGVDRYERRESPDGDAYLWNVWNPPADPDPETDAGALAQGFVTVTPLRFEANDEEAIRRIRAWDLR
jgi:5'-nucleotidase